MKATSTLGQRMQSAGMPRISEMTPSQFRGKFTDHILITEKWYEHGGKICYGKQLFVPFDVAKDTELDRFIGKQQTVDVTPALYNQFYLLLQEMGR